MFTVDEAESTQTSCSSSPVPLPELGTPNSVTPEGDKTFKYIWNDKLIEVITKLDENGNIKGRLKKYGEFSDNPTDGQEVVVSVNKSNIVEIELVYFGEKIRGICTLSVASVMYGVINHAGKLSMKTDTGKVHISTFTDGCSAFNCYDRAFRINGFELVSERQKKIVEKDANDFAFDYTLEYKRTTTEIPSTTTEIPMFHKWVNNVS